MFIIYISSTTSSSNSVTEHNLPAHPTEFFALQTDARLIGSNAEYMHVVGRWQSSMLGPGKQQKHQSSSLFGNAIYHYLGKTPQLSSIWVCLKMSKQFGDLLSTSCHQIMEDMVNMMIKHQMLGARIAAPFEKVEASENDE